MKAAGKSDVTPDFEGGEGDEASEGGVCLGWGNDCDALGVQLQFVGGIEWFGLGGTSGTVTLTSVSSMGVDGTFDVTFPSGDHVSGKFSAGNCTHASGGSGPSC